VKCNVDTERYGVEITCESGTATITYNDSITYEGQVIKVKLNQERTYENTGNTYKIVGDIVVDKSADKVGYHITVTGGVFGETPQICEK
jgi:5,10-methylene-tetrahydrofolate dehydrogenase/methenyl tetrahydrofolate cyclohydrolase